MACVYEGVILFGVVFFFGYAYSALLHFDGASSTLRTGFQIYLFCILGAYFGWLWSHDRWTLPMKTMGVKLVRDDGHYSPLSLGRALWRYVLASLFFWGGLALLLRPAPARVPALALLLWLLPFFWSLFDHRRRTLYDILAGTLLIRQEGQEARRAAQA